MTITPAQTAPSATAVQISGHAPGGGWLLEILAKRTYLIDDVGRYEPAPEQFGLLPAPTWDPELPELLVADMETFTYKLRTDVVVRGHLHGDGEARRLTAEVAVANRPMRLAIVGERRCALSPTGTIVISEPAPIGRVPLRYTHAYGGRDAMYESSHGNPIRDDPRLYGMTLAEADAASPYLYPRNPCGRGYLIEPTREAVEQLELPLIEDPADLLTSDRLAVHDFRQWYRMPLPRGTDWIDYGWYPRIAFFGVVPICERFDDPPAEVTLGLVPPALAAGDGKKPPEHAFEASSGASLALQVPYLRGGEPVALQHIHPRRSRWGWRVPPPPELAVDARDGRLRAVEPVLHTLLIEPDDGRLTLVWRGCAPALRRHGPRELEVMPMRVAWND